MPSLVRDLAQLLDDAGVPSSERGLGDQLKAKAAHRLSMIMVANAFLLVRCNMKYALSEEGQALVPKVLFMKMVGKTLF